ncbi:MAG: hypothetical protein IKM34_01390 [Clostridia bacterium]|nr:hypothetical protein [Clostridia bacterium]
MILSGKTLKQAVKRCTSCIGKPKEPYLSCRFDTSHALYQNKHDKKPLFACSYQGNFSLPLVKALLFVAAGTLILSYCCHKRKKTNHKKMS